MPDPTLRERCAKVLDLLPVAFMQPQDLDKIEAFVKSERKAALLAERDFMRVEADFIRRCLNKLRKDDSYAHEMMSNCERRLRARAEQEPENE